MGEDGSYLELRKAGNVGGEGKKLPDLDLVAGNAINAAISQPYR